MNEAIQNYAEVGLIHFMAYPETIRGEGPIVETLRRICADDYFSLVEITHIEDDAVRQAAKSLIEQSAIKCAYGAQPVLLTRKLNLNHPDESARRAAVEAVKNSIDEAVEVGCRGLAFLSGSDPGELGRPEALRLLAESVEEMCDHARTRGDFPLALETFDRLDFAKNTILGPTREAVEFAERMRNHYPKFGLMVDLSHMPLLGETVDEMLNTAKDVLTHVHIGNCVMSDPNHPAYGDEHPRFGIEGGENGVEELAAFLEGLLEIGYLDRQNPRPLSFEVKPVAAFGEDSEMVIANAKRTLNRAWAMV